MINGQITGMTARYHCSGWLSEKTVHGGKEPAAYTGNPDTDQSRRNKAVVNHKAPDFGGT